MDNKYLEITIKLENDFIEVIGEKSYKKPLGNHCFSCGYIDEKWIAWVKSVIIEIISETSQEQISFLFKNGVDVVCEDGMFAENFRNEINYELGLDVE